MGWLTWHGRLTGAIGATWFKLHGNHGMDINITLILLVGTSCVVRLLRTRQDNARGWLVVSGLILAVLVAMLFLAPEQAGWVSATLWAVLMLLPLLGLVMLNGLILQERYTLAWWVAACLRWLHPADGWIEYPHLIRGLALEQQGKVDAASQIFQRYSGTATPVGRTAAVYFYRLNARWDEFLAWVDSQMSQERVFSDAALSTYYLRSLGETGDLNGLLQTLERIEPNLEKTGNLPTRNLARLFVLAFCGQPQSVQQLLRGPLAIRPRSFQQFWLATAEAAAGNESSAQQRFAELESVADPGLQNAIAWRLSHPRIDPDEVLTATSRQTLQHLITRMEQELRYDDRATFNNRKLYGTYSLLAANLVMFALEVQLGGSENLLTLYRLGAMVPEQVFAGDWWRLLAATFLHFGPVHLLFNMIGLYYFGAFVETSLKTRRFLIAYFFSGVGSMLLVATLSVLTDAPPVLHAGASGAIMGLLGVMGAVLLKAWRRENARIAAKRLRTILFIIAFQTVYDLSMPQVSFLGHVSGLFLGFLAGLVLFSPKSEMVR
jgi:rhomboid protease GluP